MTPNPATSNTPAAWQISTLRNGLRVITTSIPATQAAAVGFFVRIGSRGEEPRTNGLSHYLEHMLFKGTERRPSAPLISEAIEGAGGGLNAYTTHEMTCYWNNLPFEAVETGIDVVADMLQHSLLDQEEINRERTVVQQEIRRSHDNPGQWVGELATRAVFGDQPLGWAIAGSIETVEAMHRPDFIAHMDRFYTAENSVLSVAGNVAHEQVLACAERCFGDLHRGTPDPMPGARQQIPTEHVLVEPREIEQTNLTLMMYGVGRRDPDRYALEMLNGVLGRGMSSRLFKEVRERRGLAYSVGSGATRFADAGTLTVSAGVTREHQEEALQVIIAELHRLVSEPVPAEELQRVRDYLVGSFRLSLETSMALGQRHGNQLLMDGEIESIETTVAGLRGVTAEDIQRVARRIIEPRQFALAVVGPSASADRLDAILTA